MGGMCKERADGTWRYCPSRQPGARSSQKMAARAAAAQRAEQLAQALPARGSVRQQEMDPPAALADSGRAWFEGMTPQQRSAVRNYSSLTDRPINTHLNRNRGALGEDADATMLTHHVYDEDGAEVEHRQESLARSVLTLDEALEACPRAKDPHVLYRGMTVKDGTDPHQWAQETFTEGRNVVLPGFASTSADPMIAMGFTRTHGVILEISTRQSAYMDEFSDYGGDIFGEKEVLLERNSRFKVIGVERGEVREDVDFYGGAREPAIVVQLAEVEPEEIATADKARARAAA